MLEIEAEMKRVILFFTLKHKGHWEKIYNAIKTKENITLVEMDAIKDKYRDNYISIIDRQYPDNFKEIYMPPLSLFLFGNQDLLNDQNKIHSLWSASGYTNLAKVELNKNTVYAVLMSNAMIPIINELTEQGYKFIAISDNYFEKRDIGKLKMNQNVLYLSEIPFETIKPEIANHQTCHRLLLGVSQVAIALDITSEFMKNIYPLFEFEKRTLITSSHKYVGKDQYSFLKPASTPSKSA